MATSEHIIKAPGMMKNLAVGGHLTTADQILDDTLNKNQSVINQERIAAEATEKNRAESAEELLRQAYEALTQSAIVVGELPVSGQETVIYRVPGESSYKDYMWNGTQFVEMAEYDNAIDDDPIASSNNIVKSGGVYNSVTLSANTLDSVKAKKDLGANIVDPEYIEVGKYLRTDGVVKDADSDVWSVSGFIPVFGNNVITNAWKSDPEGANIASIVVYDVYKNFIRSYQETDQYEYQEGDYYIRFSVNQRRTPYGNYGYTLTDYEKYTEHAFVDFIYKYYSSLISLTQVNLVDQTKLEYGKYIYQDGRILSTEVTRFSVSDYIPVFGSDIMYNGYNSPEDTIHSYNVYNKEKALIRTVHDRFHTYIYQEGDFYIRFCFNRRVKGSESAYYNHYPPIYGAIQDKEIFKGVNAVLSDINNGDKEMLCTNNARFAYTQLVPTVSIITDYYWYMEQAYDEADSYLRTIVLSPDMSKYIYYDAIVQNTSNTDSKFIVYASKDQTYSEESTIVVYEKTIPRRSYEKVHIPIDLANLTVYYGYTDSIAFWMSSGKIDGVLSTGIQIYGLEIYQLSNEKSFNNISGENLEAVLESVDNIISAGSQVSSEQYLVSPNGDRFLLQVNSNNELILIPLYTDTVFYFGNSLTNGLAASAPQYKYRSLIDAFLQDNISGTLNSSNLRSHSFEMSHTLQDAKDNADLAIAACPSNAGLIIVQLGDNVSASDYTTVFEPALDYLAKGLRTKAQGARVIFVASWYGNVTSVMQTVSNKYGCLFVNIKDLNVVGNQSYIGAVRKQEETGERNVQNVTNVAELTPDTGYSYKLSVTFTANSTTHTSVIHANSYSLDSTTLTYTSDESVVQTSGEASHPGDNGFRLIANRILYESGMTGNSEYYR